MKFTVYNQEKSDEPTEIIMSGPIGSSWWDDSGVDSAAFRKQMNAVPKGRKISLRINSEGGSVQDGLEMYNVIKDRAADVTAYIDGYALSIASVLPLAAGKVVSPKSSIWMIHEPWSYTSGNADDHLKSAEMLDTHGDTLAAIYAKELGKSKTEMRAEMKKESWFTGEEAVDFGFADETGEDDDEESPLAALDTKIFKNIPKNLLTILSEGRSQVTQRRVAASAGVAKTPFDNQIMKAKLLAILAKRKVATTEDMTVETLAALVEQTEPTAAAPVIVTANGTEDIASIRAQLATEKRARITDTVTARAANKIPTANLAFWIDLAVKDEAGTLAQLDALPTNEPGGRHLGHVQILHENPLDKIKSMEGGASARLSHMVGNWNGLIADAMARDSRRGGAVAANTYSSSLITQFLIDGAVTKLQNRWAALKVFAKDYSTDQFKPRATGQLKFVTAGGAAQTNATNFESGDSTVTNVAISVSQYTAAYHVTNDELNSGLRMENLMDVNLAVLADTIIGVAVTPITTANFTSIPAIVRAPGAFTWADMTTAWGDLKKSPIHNALLDGEYLAKIINVPSQFQKTGVMPGTQWSEFGWDNIALNTNWTSAGANVRGFFCNPQAVGCIAGLPITPPNIPGQTLIQAVATLPDINISIAVYSWFSLATRTMWASYDMMFGASLLDATAGVLLTSQ